jgi:hypothetical protein
MRWGAKYEGLETRNNRNFLRHEIWTKPFEISLPGRTEFPPPKNACKSQRAKICLNNVLVYLWSNFEIARN